jgi:hypothetical protein
MGIDSVKTNYYDDEKPKELEVVINIKAML